MADIWSKQKRSDVMSRIRSQGNKETELRLIEIFKDEGIKGWRRKHKLVGKPDFVFRKERVAVFVDGCFWHGCPKCYMRPKSNKQFWDEKLRRNKARDRKVTRELKSAGWKVIRIWQHQLQKQKNVAKRIKNIIISF